MGLNLACIVQRFLRGSAIPGRGAFPRWCQRVVSSSLAAVSLSVPAQPSSSEVGELLEECESSDDVNCHQLLKDYHEAQADLSSTRPNAEMLRGELDAACDALQASKNLASQARANLAITQ
jgi:hypothetical protein